MQDQGKSKKTNQQGKLDELEVIHQKTAGIDLGATAHYVSVSRHLVDSTQESLRVFKTHQEGLESMSGWLKELGVQSVAMEATGVYWLGAYEALEKLGIEVCLVNARHVKNVSGRKSDESDSRWLQRLHSYGLLRPSFIPAEAIRDLRSYLRHRQNLEQEKSRSILHLHKSLDMMNVKVHHSIKNIDGQTGLRILRAIIAGQHDPDQLGQLHTKRLKVSKADLIKSLKGNYKAAHIFSLKQALKRYDFTVDQMKECDLQIEQMLAHLTGTFGNDLPHKDDLEQPMQAVKKKGKKNDFHFDVNHYLIQLTQVDLCQIDGIGTKLALQIISEIGLNMDRWPTSKHFTSWLGLAPRQKISGGKLIGHYRHKKINQAGRLFCKAAFTLSNSRSALGAYYRSMRARKGPQIANMATARKIAIILYNMMSKKVEFQPSSTEEYQQKRTQRQLQKIRRAARSLGLELVEATSSS